MYKGCVTGGWVDLLRWFIDPLVNLQEVEGNDEHNARVQQSHANLAIEIEQWLLYYVGEARLDNRAMIDYIDELYAKSEAVTGRRIPLNNWAPLENIIAQQDSIPALLPVMRLTNVCHIINRFAGRSLAIASFLTDMGDVWVNRDDFLELAQACHNGLVECYSYVANPDQDIIGNARTRMLHHALASRPGVPAIVRWLTLDARVPLFTDDRHAVLCLLENGQRHNPYVLRENMACVLEAAGGDDNAPLPGLQTDVGLRDPAPLISWYSRTPPSSS
ncbi:hypothetical protein PG997_001901 [Apiospora hydei]|uniref:Uncharacterized protein n=1 Tax=Apiospora hydei TaxID=1337664 RepID=A0ABR1X7V5_9PEZI